MSESESESGWPGPPKPNTQLVSIGAIRIPPRHRKDVGDLRPLAESIRAHGLLHPIVLTPDFELVAGERRLRAVQHVLGWTQIPASIVDIDCVLEGEAAENALRKNLTVSERLAIAEHILEKLAERERRGRPSGAIVDSGPRFPAGRSRDIAAQRAGFGSAHTLRLARQLADNGIPELVTAVDNGEMTITAGARLAAMSPEMQRSSLGLAGPAGCASANQTSDAEAEHKPEVAKGRRRPAASDPRQDWTAKKFLKALQKLRAAAWAIRRDASPAQWAKILEEAKRFQLQLASAQPDQRRPRENPAKRRGASAND
jgi:ParB-like chromosome segregation protein Spo0J